MSQEFEYVVKGGDGFTYDGEDLRGGDIWTPKGLRNDYSIKNSRLVYLREVQPEVASKPAPKKRGRPARRDKGA